MKFHPRFALLGLLLPLFGTPATAADTAAKIAFSSPDKPGTLVVSVSNGHVSIRGEDVDVVTILSELSPEKNGKVRSDGLRVIGSSSQFSVDEKDNVITLNYGRMGWSDDADFEITVPRNTNLSVQMNLGGEIEIADVNGDVDIKNLNGEVSLENLGGGAIVESMNGEIYASFATLPKQKPLAFSSMNGEITVEVPADATADIRFRTQNGTIMTDFDDEALITETEPGSSSMGYTSSDEARRQAREVGRQAAEAARAASEIAREVAREVKRGFNGENATPDPRVAAPAAPAMPAMPAMPAIPTLAGGKVISGKLNGGGASLQIATMNGDIILRHSSGDR